MVSYTLSGYASSFEGVECCYCGKYFAPKFKRINMRHSKVRNVVKHIYDLLKAINPNLRDMPHEYDFNTQCNTLSSFLPDFFCIIKN